MSLATTFLAAALVVPSMPPPEFDDYEVITNCVFDASRQDAKEFAVRIELDATPSNGVEVVFGRDVDGDGVLSRAEETLSVGYDCGEWKCVNLTAGNTFSSSGVSGRVALNWKLRLANDKSPRSVTATVNGQPAFTQLCQSPPTFLFDSSWNAVKVVRRGQDDPNPQIVCSVNNEPFLIRLR